MFSIAHVHMTLLPPMINRGQQIFQFFQFVFLNINTSNRSTRGLSGVVGQGHLFEVVHNITGNEQRPFSAPDLQSLAPGFSVLIFKDGRCKLQCLSNLRGNAPRPIINTHEPEGGTRTDDGVDETSSASIFLRLLQLFFPFFH